MQRRILDNIHLGKTVNPFESIGDLKALERTMPDFLNDDHKVKKIKRIFN